MNHGLAVTILVALAACATPKPPPVTCPAVATDPAPPPPDAALARWKALAADDKAPPPATAVDLDTLVDYLGSTDPVRRDEVAYTLLDRWIRGPLSLDQLRALRDRLVANLTRPQTEPNGVFRRSFSALTLASIVRRDLATPFFTDDERRALLSAAVAYAHAETDLRGYTGAPGWAHAAAHTADLLAALAREPSFTAGDRAHILDAVTGFVVRRHGAILHHGEDGRLAVPVLLAARAGLDRAALDTWLATIRAPLDEQGGEAFDAGLYAAQRNARNLLFTLFVQASLAPEPTDGTRALLSAVTAAVAK